MAINTGWAIAELDPKKIVLDALNPRIEVPPGATQDEIRAKLLKLEDVLDLARSIAQNGGLSPGERIITTIEDGKQVVLEGNRRVTACQLLLTPTLVPQEFEGRFPEASLELKRNIRRIDADVAPDRLSAEPILTRRHTESSAKPWSPVAKMRRAANLLDTHSVDQVAATLGTSAASVRKLIKPYRLLQYALNLGSWTEAERAVLENEKLKTNPYTRFFTLSDTQRILRLSFDEHHHPVSGHSDAVFRKLMTAIARDFLLPDPVTRRPKCDTRTEPLAYFAEFLETPAGRKAFKESPAPANTGQNAPGQRVTGNGNAGGRPSPQVPPQQHSPQQPPSKPLKQSSFFENLECHVVDDNLIALTNEIKTINHLRMPIAASMMMRSLFECALVYKIKQVKKWGEVLKLAPDNKKGWDPGLSDLIKYAGNFNNGVFAERNICKVLNSHQTTQAKDYLDSMTHLKYRNADPLTVGSTANHIRNVIKYILEGN